jgi:hypothetical protein
MYQYNRNYFKNIDTTEKAYWLGYLYADGYIRKNPYNVLLTSIDREVIQKFQKSLKSNLPICKDNRQKNTRYYIRIGSKQMVKDLEKLNCLSPKSLTITFPKFLKQNFKRHFIRGYFDGDGWITNTKYPKHFNISFCSGSKEFLKRLRQILFQDLKLNKVNIYFSKTNCYSITYGITKIKNKVYKYLYNNASIFLNRKHRIFMERIKK